MITIVNADQSYLAIIRQIALDTWPATFEGILSKEQIDYMLELMYSITSLQKQIGELNHKFILAKEEEKYYGYASYELNSKSKPNTKIHKIYILPESQGKGVGKALMMEIEKYARLSKNNSLTLNVNRQNRAVDFYEKLGFKIVGQEDISIGNGFLMEDFIMQKKLE